MISDTNDVSFLIHIVHYTRERFHFHVDGPPTVLQFASRKMVVVDLCNFLATEEIFGLKYEKRKWTEETAKKEAIQAKKKM